MGERRPLPTPLSLSLFTAIVDPPTAFWGVTEKKPDNYRVCKMMDVPGRTRGGESVKMGGNARQGLRADTVGCCCFGPYLPAPPSLVSGCFDGAVCLCCCFPRCTGLRGAVSGFMSSALGWMVLLCTICGGGIAGLFNGGQCLLCRTGRRAPSKRYHWIGECCLLGGWQLHVHWAKVGAAREGGAFVRRVG